MSIFNDQIELSYYSGSDRSISYKLATYDRFNSINGFLQGIKSYCRNPVHESNTMLISKDGNVWFNDTNAAKDNKIFRNNIIDSFKSVNDISQIGDIEYVLKREHAKTFEHGFGKSILKDISHYGITDVYPEFFGIEISFIASNYFSMGCSMVKICGPGAETFHNTRTLMS